MIEETSDSIVIEVDTYKIKVPKSDILGMAKSDELIISSSVWNNIKQGREINVSLPIT